MNREVLLVLPYPPSANRYWRVFRGRPVVSAAATAYKDVVKGLVGGLIATPWEGPIVLHLDVFRPRRAGDLSNTVKVLEDALRGLVYVDDSQVIDIRTRRFESKYYPAVQACIVEMGEELDAPPERWPMPQGWSAASERMKAVREEERERDKRRAAKREAANGLGATPTPSYRKGTT